MEVLYLNIQYRESKSFEIQELYKLFKSVNWLSANHPERLQKAISGSSTVISAWDNGKLVALINAIDDGEMTAYVHYLLVHPEYQRHGIAAHLINCIKEKYKDFLYLIIIPDDVKNVTLYEKFGFRVMAGSTPMYVFNQ